MVTRCNLRALRAQHKIGLRALARAAQVPPSTIYRLERNTMRAVELPTIDKLMAGFAVLGHAVTIADILPNLPDEGPPHA